MASPINPATYTAGTALTAAQMNAIRDNTTAAQNPATVQCYQATTGQSIPANTATAVLFNTNLYDPYSMHSTVTNTSRITIPTGWGGKYRFNAAITWPAPGSAPAGVTYVQMQIFKNNALWAPSVREIFPVYSGVQQTTRLVWEGTGAVADYFEVFVLTGGTVSLATTLVFGANGCAFTATWVSL